MKQRLAWLALAGALAACTPTLREDVEYMLYKDAQRWHASDRIQDVRDFFQLDALLNTFRRREQLAEREVCLHANSQQRVVSQNGISDAVPYTWCVLQPLEAEPAGQRLDGRRS